MKIFAGGRRAGVVEFSDLTALPVWDWPMLAHRTATIWPSEIGFLARLPTGTDLLASSYVRKISSQAVV